MAMNTSEVTVLGVVCRRGQNGKYQIFLQVQTRPGAPLAYVKGPIGQPPLPGTRIKVTGNVSTTSHGPLVQIKSDADIENISCPQGVLTRDLFSSLLDRFDIPHDKQLLEKTCFSDKYTLVNLDKTLCIELLTAAGVQNAAAIVHERETLFASLLTKGLLDGVEKIKVPYQPNAKRDTPFKSDMWPSDVMAGFFPDYMKVSHGQLPHSKLDKKVYLTDFVKHEGIDNFYRSLAVYRNDPAIFSEWLQENKRSATIASAFIKDKQKEGVQVFDNAAFKQLERFGIAQVGKTLSRLGQMYQIKVGDEKNALISQGAYQSNSRIATLDKLSRSVEPLKVTVNKDKLDAEQAKALQTFCDGKPLLLVSGSAGTGKSTLAARMISHAVVAGEKVVVVSLAGKAASRLNISMEKENLGFHAPFAQTIHGLFYQGKHSSFTKNIHINMLKPALDSTAVQAFPVRVDRALHNASFVNGKEKDLKLARTLIEEMAPPAVLTGATVFIDEASQDTSDLFALILEMRPKRIVMIGDQKQLRPVGVGRPFHDLIDLYNEGKLHDLVEYVELKTDHRATKELSAFTDKVRHGELPLGSVTTYDKDMDTPAGVVDAVFHKEGSILECSDTTDSKNLVEAIFNKEISKAEPFYQFSSRNNPVAGDKKSLTIELPCKIAAELSTVKALIPDVMLIGSTNSTVNELADTVKSILRPHTSPKQTIKSFPLFSNFMAGGHLPGDVVMQTANANRRIGYTTPEGTHVSAKTMNGETYVFVGANAWLPLPTGSSISDIEFAVNNAWEGSGLKQLVQSIKHDDPDAHADLYAKLLAIADTNEHAQTLLSMALGELIMLPQHALRELNAQKPAVISCADTRVVRVPVLPEKPFSINNGIVNDAGSMGLVRDVWRVHQVHGNKAVPGRSQIEYPHYVSLAEEAARMQGTFSSGNAFTSHKAQGSQAKMSVLVVEPPMNEEDSSNHEEGVYTGITRAELKSMVILHGKTASELNQIWSATRTLEANKFSAIKAIARGEISPLCDTLRMTSVATPHCKTYAMPGTSRDVGDYRKRVALSSMGLPSEVNAIKPEYGIADLYSSLYPNAGVATALYPDGTRLAETTTDALVLANKRKFTWNRGMIADQTAPEVKDIDLDNLLSDVLSDSSGNGFMF